MNKVHTIHRCGTGWLPWYLAHPKTTAQPSVVVMELKNVSLLHSRAAETSPALICWGVYNWGEEALIDTFTEGHAFNHPLMAKAARGYLLVPSAVVRVERQFNGAGDVVLGLPFGPPFDQRYFQFSLKVDATDAVRVIWNPSKLPKNFKCLSLLLQAFNASSGERDSSLSTHDI